MAVLDCSIHIVVGSLLLLHGGSVRGSERGPRGCEQENLLQSAFKAVQQFIQDVVDWCMDKVRGPPVDATLQALGLCLEEGELCGDTEDVRQCCGPYSCVWEPAINDYICKLRDLGDVFHNMMYYIRGRW